MSGIYIPNFEPSKEGYISCIYPDGTVVKPKNEEPFYEIYKAIPVPDHGDLIGRDALIEDIANMVPWAITDPTANAFLDGLSAAYETIKAAPTIIPAERAE